MVLRAFVEYNTEHGTAPTKTSYVSGSQVDLKEKLAGWKATSSKEREGKVQPTLLDA